MWKNPLAAMIIGAIIGGLFVSGGDEKQNNASESAHVSQEPTDMFKPHEDD